MRITERDQEMFRALNASEMGKQLVDYLDRLADSAYDARNWGTEGSLESAKLAEKLIREDLRDKISLRQQLKGQVKENHNDYV